MIKGQTLIAVVITWVAATSSVGCSGAGGGPTSDWRSKTPTELLREAAEEPEGSLQEDLAVSLADAMSPGEIAYLSQLRWHEHDSTVLLGDPVVQRLLRATMSHLEPAGQASAAVYTSPDSGFAPDKSLAGLNRAMAGILGGAYREVIGVSIVAVVCYVNPGACLAGIALGLFLSSGTASAAELDASLPPSGGYADRDLANLLVHAGHPDGGIVDAGQGVDGGIDGSIADAGVFDASMSGSDAFVADMAVGDAGNMGPFDTGVVPYDASVDAQMTDSGVIVDSSMPVDAAMCRIGIDVLRFCDFSFMDLSGAQLAGTDLTGVDLTGANLTGANLTNAVLRGARVTNANFTAATLDGLASDTLQGTTALLPANWSVTSGHLVGPNANLAGAQLAGVNLSTRNVAGARFDGAVLTNANLTDANVTGCDFSSANLSGATLVRTSIANADFSTANMAGLTTNGVVGVPLVLDGGWRLVAGFLLGPGAKPWRLQLTSVDLSGLSLRGAELVQSALTDVRLDGVDLEGATLTSPTWRGILGVPLRLPTSDWRIVGGFLFGPGASVRNRNLSGLDLSGMNLSQADLSFSVLDGANLSNANLTSASLGEASLRNASLLNATLSGAYLVGVTWGNTVCPNGMISTSSPCPL